MCDSPRRSIEDLLKIRSESLRMIVLGMNTHKRCVADREDKGFVPGELESKLWIVASLVSRHFLNLEKLL